MAFAVAAIVTGVAVAGAAVAGAVAYGAATTADAQSKAGQAAEDAGNQSAADLQVALSQAMARGDTATADAIKRQQQATSDALAIQKEQYSKIKELLTPYVDTGTKSLLQQENLAGLNGDEAQQQAYAALKNSPAYQALNKAGQDAILANASATGGVRGGNTQGALAQFGTANLANAIDRQYSQLGGLTQLGYNATSQQAGYNANQAANESQIVQSGGVNEANYLYNNGQNQASNILNIANAAAGYQNAGANANIQAQLGSATTMANLPVNALMGALGAGLGIYGAMPTGNIVGQPQSVPLFNQDVPFAQGGFKL